MEIEHKYLLSPLKGDALVVLSKVPASFLEQYYLISQDGISLRIRRSTDLYVPVWQHHTMTLKVDTEDTNVRHEFEEVISVDAFWRLRTNATKQLSKVRYRYLDTTDLTLPHLWSIDSVSTQDNHTVWLAEMELLSETSVVPQLPEFLQPYLIREVTDDPTFRNENLAWNFSHAPR